MIGNRKYEEKRLCSVKYFLKHKLHGTEIIMLYLYTYTSSYVMPGNSPVLAQLMAWNLEVLLHAVFKEEFIDKMSNLCFYTKIVKSIYYVIETFYLFYQH